MHFWSRIFYIVFFILILGSCSQNNHLTSSTGKGRETIEGNGVSTLSDAELSSIHKDYLYESKTLWRVSTNPEEDKTAIAQIVKVGSQSFDEVSVWNGNGTRIFSLLDERSSNIALSPDGSKLALGNRTNLRPRQTAVRVLNSSTGERLFFLRVPSGVDRADVEGLLWTPDGQGLIVYFEDFHDHIVALFDVSQENRPGGSFIGPVWTTVETIPSVSTVESASFHPNGSALALQFRDNAFETSILFFNADTGEEMHRYKFEGDDACPYTLSWSQDGSKFATARGVYDADTGEPLGLFPYSCSTIYAIAWSPDSQQIVMGHDPYLSTTSVVILDVSEPVGATSEFTEIMRINAPDWDAIYRDQVFWNQNNDTIVAAGRLSVGFPRTGDVRTWDATTGQLLKIVPRHGFHISNVYAVSYSPDGTKFATGSRDKTIRLWDTELSDPLATLDGHADSVYAVTWSPDGNKLASASKDRTIKVWDVATESLLNTFRGHSYIVRDVAWSPDGTKLASASWDKTARIWDVETGEVLFTLDGHTDLVNSVAWNITGDKLLTSSKDKTLKVWDTTTGLELQTIAGHTGEVFAATWSPDNSKIASASGDLTIKVWEASTGQETLNIEGHTETIRDVTWSPDGTTLASGSRDQTVKFWDAETGQLIFSREEPDYTVFALDWHPSGNELTAAVGDAVILTWQLLHQ